MTLQTIAIWTVWGIWNILMIVLIIRGIKGIKAISTKDALIDKACDYLYEWNKNQVIKNDIGKPMHSIHVADYTINVTDFRKAMED